MENRITIPRDESAERNGNRLSGALPIGEILQELLAQYQVQFPGIRIAVVETPANAL
jgi:hypothetical protein